MTQSSDAEEKKVEETVQLNVNGTAEGWILKQSRYLKSWRKRYMMLKNGTLHTYETNDKIKLTETIYIKETFVVEHDTDSKFNLYSKDPTQPNSKLKLLFSFKGLSDTQSKAWIERIQEFIKIEYKKRIISELNQKGMCCCPV